MNNKRITVDEEEKARLEIMVEKEASIERWQTQATRNPGPASTNEKPLGALTRMSRGSQEKQAMTNKMVEKEAFLDSWQTQATRNPGPANTNEKPIGALTRMSRGSQKKQAPTNKMSKPAAKRAARERPQREHDDDDDEEDNNKKPGAVKIPGLERRSIESHMTASEESMNDLESSSMPIPLAAEIAPDTDMIIAERDELRRALKERERQENILVVGAVAIEDSKDEDPPNTGCSRTFLVAVVVLLLVLVIGLGVGLGLGLQKDTTDDDDSPKPAFDPSPSAASNPSSTGTPTLRPSPFPTSAPTRSAAPTVSFQPTTSGCVLNMTIECAIEDDFYETCEDVLFFARSDTLIQCTFKPFKMEFFYSGENCTAASLEDQDFYSCQDFRGGPADHDGMVYLRAYDGNNGNVYHEDFIYINETFATNPEDFIIGDKINITVYDPKNLTDPDQIVTPENLLQSVQFDNTCAYRPPCADDDPFSVCLCSTRDDKDAPCFDFYLTRPFGSVKLVEYINQEQGRITAFPQLDMSVSTWAEGLNNVTLTELNVIGNMYETPFNLTSEVAGERLTPGGDLYTVGFSFEADMLSNILTRYTFFGTVIGETDSSDSCNGWNFFEVIG